MSDLNEQERYALLSNVPYLIFEGVPIDVIEQDLREYGIDYNIDTEFTNDERATLVSDGEVVHAIRGTANLQDILNDLKLGTSITKLFTTITSKPYLQPSHREQHNALTRVLDYIPDTTNLMTYIKEHAPKGYKRQIPKTLNPELRYGFSERMNTPNRLLKSLPTLPIVVGATGTAISRASNKLIEAIYPDNLDRFKKEYQISQDVLAKYPNRQHRFTAHSLGGAISNHISRKMNIPSITFNPAPAHEDQDKRIAGSRVYKTNWDIVSNLREGEPEDITTVSQRVMRPHSLANFLPDKSKKRLPLVLQQSTLARPSVTRTSIINRKRPNFCELYPDNPICKREDQVFLV